jgi:tRNA dimethylallyltransferase
MFSKSKILNLKSKILVLVGPTSSGKSELAVKLARRFNGEIISADSRQIYRGLNLGTGKIPGKWISVKTHGRVFYRYKGIFHHCIDYVNPKKQFSAALFKKDAQKAISAVLKRGKLPILCGGTAHWIDAVVYNQKLPDVKPNKKLRAALEKKSADVLYHRLLKLDPTRAKTIDRFNKRRLIRALEIVISTGRPVPTIPSAAEGSLSSLGVAKYNVLWLGIKTNQTDLYKKIERRLKERFKQGMIKEVADLHNYPLQSLERVPRANARGGRGLSWKRLNSFGLEYRFVSLYLQKKITFDQMFTQLLFAIKHYSKRQLTWWKKNKEIKWINPQTKPASKLIYKFLTR